SPILLALDTFVHVCRHFDGRNSLAEILKRVEQETSQLISREALERLGTELDQAMVLEGPAFARFRASFQEAMVRPAALAGRSYTAGDAALRTQLAQYFASDRGAGQPPRRTNGSSRRLRGVLSPHIDYHRGGPVYTWSYQQILEQSDIDTFVILGVAH